VRNHAIPLSLVAILLAQAGPAQGRTPGEPPAGTPEDRSLWTAIRDVAGEAEIAMGRVGQCAYRLRYGGYREGLEAAAGVGPSERAGEARALREALDRSAGEAQSAIPPDGGRVRECRYTLLYLEQRMEAPADNAITRELPEVREDGRRCVERLRKLVEEVRPAADALESRLEEIDLFLGRVGKVPGGPDRR